MPLGPSLGPGPAGQLRNRAVGMKAGHQIRVADLFMSMAKPSPKGNTDERFESGRLGRRLKSLEQLKQNGHTVLAQPPFHLALSRLPQWKA